MSLILLSGITMCFLYLIENAPACWLMFFVSALISENQIVTSWTSRWADRHRTIVAERKKKNEAERGARRWQGGQNHDGELGVDGGWFSGSRWPKGTGASRTFAGYWATWVTIVYPLECTKNRNTLVSFVFCENILCGIIPVLPSHPGAIYFLYFLPFDYISICYHAARWNLCNRSFLFEVLHAYLPA